MNYRIYLINVLLILSLFGCHKKFTSPATRAISLPPFKLTEGSQLLLDKTWREANIEVIHLSTEDQPKDNITRQFLSTDLDDELTFYEDGTYTYDEGQSKARESHLHIYEKGNWALEDKRLVLLNPNSSTRYILRNLSSDTLVLEYRVKSEKYYYLLTYKAL
ncbi:MAG: hypothetical protein AAFU64_00415 [Bacteroidota bacterium]